MSIFLLSYSPLICFGLIMIFLSFAPYASPRVVTLVISFGGLLLSFILTKIIILDSNIIAISNTLNFIKINFGLFLENINILLININIFSFIIIIFFTPTKRRSGDIIFLCVIYLTITMPFLFSNLLISMSIYSILSVFIMYFSIVNNDRKLSTAHLTTDFIWHRASDIAAFISILLIFITHKQLGQAQLSSLSSLSTLIYFPHAPLFFGAMILRIITIPASNNYIKFSADNGFNYFVLGRIFSSLGALLFLIKFSNIIFYSTKLNNFYLIIAGILLCHVLFNIIKYNNIIFLPTNLSYLLLILSLGALALEKTKIAFIILLVLIILTPILILFTSEPKFVSKKSEELPASDDPVTLVGQLAKILAFYGAQLSARFASIFYANFLFYRLPQLITGLFQIPLRIFHTGSIQRSLLFIVLLIALYYWRWGVEN